MQLNKYASLGASLAMATSSLLGSANTANAAQWQADAGALIYNENDSRIQAVEPALNIKREFSDGSSLNLHGVYDTLTGASPNGAARANKLQTFTSASGRAHENEEDSTRGVYTIAPGETPLDNSFKDQRGVVSIGWTTAPKNGYTATTGAAISSEHDFTSFSVNGAIKRDFNDKNTTLSLGTNLEFDNIKPIGGVPVPLGTYSAHATQNGQDSKQVYDLMAGLTQAINRHWIAQLNISVSASSGYQNDPYKMLTVANDGNLMLDPGEPQDYLYLYESRPDKRNKTSVYLQNKFSVFSDDAIDVDYRRMQDDWGISSDTLDLTYHKKVSDRFYFEPHYRFYRQSAADFYYPFLDAGSDVIVTESSVQSQVAHASSDPRLAAFTADTVGLKLGFPVSDDEEYSVRVEYYQQQDDNSASALPPGSDLYGYSQFPALKAAWLQIGYHYSW